MKRPEPKAEVEIRVASTRILKITTHGDRAAAWIASEALKFGMLSPPSPNWRRRTLFVEDGYDLDEVQAYLEFLGDRPV